ncbi:type VII toxin-antitoxin system MntA family adenylyltransferase antitoxin [Zhaonella formicivorans]|uniref:type VII toxin-antitoxin system MntA family adenylyltransferase antitoxin n=1 Tax=Zhaonella formicivorans TaxID=2528593 RepID=UPI001D10CAE2|nr:nucleotidyltransferase domain-containing protein [Zhaonella formicivorans]
MQIDLQEVAKVLEPHLAKLVQDYGILLLYIFGSYATGKNNSNSDLDIAVLLKEPYNPMDKLNLLADFTDIFRRDDIDLVILNAVGPVLKYQAIKYGKRLYEKSEEVRVNFEVRVVKEYLDMEPFRRRQFEILKAKIKGEIK